jgi:hypothetical protein
LGTWQQQLLIIVDSWQNLPSREKFGDTTSSSLYFSRCMRQHFELELARVEMFLIWELLWLIKPVIRKAILTGVDHKDSCV